MSGERRGADLHGSLCGADEHYGRRSVRPGCDLRAANTGSGDLVLLNGWNSELGLYFADDDVRLIVGRQPRPAPMPGCRAGAWGERA
jgi:hypothetical protein